MILKVTRHDVLIGKLDRCVQFAALSLFLATAPRAAMAYIDPGNGAYMVQALFTLVGAGLFYLRTPIRSLKALWSWSIDKIRRTPTVHADIEQAEIDGAEVAQERT